jgi:hypothetical protein
MGQQRQMEARIVFGKSLLGNDLKTANDNRAVGAATYGGYSALLNERRACAPLRNADGKQGRQNQVAQTGRERLF